MAKNVPHWPVQLRRMPVPLIPQGYCSFDKNALEKPIGCGAVRLHSGSRGGFLPGLSYLHLSHHLGFGGASLFPIHRCLLLG